MHRTLTRAAVRRVHVLVAVLGIALSGVDVRPQATCPTITLTLGERR